MRFGYSSGPAALYSSGGTILKYARTARLSALAASIALATTHPHPPPPRLLDRLTTKKRSEPDDYIPF